MAKLSINTLPLLLFGIVLTIINGTIVLLYVLRNIWKVGFSRYFYVKKRERPPACLANPSLGTHAFVRLKFVRLHYVYGGQEGRPLMVFLHGFPEFWYSWRHQLTEFASDYRVVAVDMRGYGESDKPAGVTSYHIDTLVEDVKDLVEALGYEKCILVGHDWGSAVGHRVCELYPDSVRMYIAINSPSHRAFNDYILTHVSQVVKSWYIFFFNIPWFPELVLRSEDVKVIDMMFDNMNCEATEEDIEAYKYTLGKPGGFTGPVNYYRASMRYSVQYGPVHRLYTPVLMIWGKKDIFLEYGTAEKCEEYIADYTLKAIEDGTHWVQMDKPEIVNKYMREFITKHQRQYNI